MDREEYDEPMFEHVGELDDEYDMDLNHGGEFINEEDEPTITGGNWQSQHSMFWQCAMAFIIVVFVLFFFRMNKFTHHKKRHVCHNAPPSNSGPVFDNTMVPSSYFDYNAHGRQYINWI